VTFGRAAAVCDDGRVGTPAVAMRIRSSAAAAVAAAITIALAGCGSSGSSSKPAGGSSDAGSAVVRAADVTGASSGYRFQATMNIASASTPLRATMSGTILSASNRGAVALRERVLGHSVNVSERYSGKTYWVSVAGIPGASALTSRPWLKYNLGSTLNQLGVGGLPSGGSNPTQFLTYLKAAGADAQKLGSQTVRGIATTHYAVTVNLNNYARLVPSADRAAARKSIGRLISTIGSSTMHMQVWIDHHNLARRLSLSFPECVAQQHLRVGMTMDLFDFGTKATVTLPADAQSYDITSLVDGQLANQKLACSAS
jgi:hypothetical protein